MSGLSLGAPELLGPWIRDRLGRGDVRDVTVTAVERVSRGVSRETWLLDADLHLDRDCEHTGFVVRRDHEVGSVDPVPLRTEYEVYRRLGPSDIPTTEALWFEDDPDRQPEGRPCYVRTRVDGHWRLPFLASDDPADDERRIEASREHLRMLALVHTADWRALDFGDLFPVPDGPADCAANLLRLFTERLDSVAFEPSPVIARGLRWLWENRPLDADAVSLCKGTNGHGEEIWQDGRIVAMSDWELACIGDPAYDFAQIQEMVPTIVRHGREIWGWDAALAYYEQRSGIHISNERLAYYRTFYALPMFVFTEHAARMVVQEGNRLARFAWTATEMRHRAELILARASGIIPAEVDR